ncbi:hypothetical protein AA11237_3349 [Acidocella aminolytica 101 = DSM 11237]|nr:hypothetical protein AA11237_3349 [Acidocella aminolytica 101 = DSM 11237]
MQNRSKAVWPEAVCALCAGSVGKHSSSLIHKPEAQIAGAPISQEGVAAHLRAKPVKQV